MEKRNFVLLSDDELGAACFKPLIEIYKSQVANQSLKDQTHIKENFYRQLNESQQALFMFYTIFNHIRKSVAEFYWWNAYFMAQPKSWAALKRGMQFFKDDDFLLLLEEIEEELKRHNHPITIESFQITRDELDRNEKLFISIKALYEQFVEISPSTVHKINQYIKENLIDFVEVV